MAGPARATVRSASSIRTPLPISVASWRVRSVRSRAPIAGAEAGERLPRPARPGARSGAAGGDLDRQQAAGAQIWRAAAALDRFQHPGGGVAGAVDRAEGEGAPPASALLRDARDFLDRGDALADLAHAVLDQARPERGAPGRRARPRRRRVDQRLHLAVDGRPPRRCRCGRGSRCRGRPGSRARGAECVPTAMAPSSRSRSASVATSGRAQFGAEPRTSRCATTPASIGASRNALDPHVDQPGDRADRVVGVQRREHEVAGQRRLRRRSPRSRGRGSRRP